MFGQWKTPPQVLYPSSGSGMKKSTSMPAFNTVSGTNPPPHLGVGTGLDSATSPYAMDESQDFGDDFMGYDLGEGSLATPPGPIPMSSFHAPSMEHAPIPPGAQPRYPGHASAVGYDGSGYHANNTDMRKVMSQQDLHSAWPTSPEAMMDLPPPSGPTAIPPPQQRGGQVRLGLLKYEPGHQIHGSSSSSMSGSPIPMSPASASPQDSTGGIGSRGQRGTGKRRGDHLDRATTVEAPQLPQSSSYTNPRHSLLSQNGMTFSSSMPSPSAASAFDDDSAMSVTGDSSGRREKRLARNRASAKMRRLKKKTMTDSLELEVNDLLRSIEFLSVLDKRRQNAKINAASIRSTGASGANGGLGKSAACPFSVQDLREAYTASRQPMQVYDDPVLMPKSAATSKKTQEEEDAAAVQQRIDEELSAMDEGELYKMFWENLVAGPTQDMSVSRPRRRAATEMFTDWEAGWADFLRISGAENSAMYFLLADQLTSTEESARATNVRRNATKSLYYRKPMPAGMSGGSGVGLGLDYHEDIGELPPASLSAPANAVTTTPKPKVLPERGASHMSAQARKVAGIDEQPLSQVYAASGHVPTNSNGSEQPLTPAQVKQKLEMLRKDLQKTLQFTDEQRAQIRQLAVGLQREQICLHAFHRILTAMATNEWLMYPAIEEIHEGFRGVLLTNQMEKFKAWSLDNLRAIRSLDIVPPRTTQQQFP